MLERLLYGALVVAALASAPGCSTLQRSQIEVQDEFYKSRKITKESTDKGVKKQEARYEYKNGIEARVTYIKMQEDAIDVHIYIDEDPHNILVRNIPVQNTPSGSSYRIKINGEKVTRTIGFCWNESMVQIVLEGERVKEVTADGKNFPWYILFEKKGWEALPGVETDIEGGYHTERCRKM